MEKEKGTCWLGKRQKNHHTATTNCKELAVSFFLFCVFVHLVLQMVNVVSPYNFIMSVFVSDVMPFLLHATCFPAFKRGLSSAQKRSSFRNTTLKILNEALLVIVVVIISMSLRSPFYLCT